MKLWISNIEYKSMSMRIALESICVVELLHHIQDRLVIFNVTLAPSYNTTSLPHDGGSLTKMISLNDDVERVWKVLTKFRWST